MILTIDWIDIEEKLQILFFFRESELLFNLADGHVTTQNLGGINRGGGTPKSRILVGYYGFNANISFTF